MWFLPIPIRKTDNSKTWVSFCSALNRQYISKTNTQLVQNSNVFRGLNFTFTQHCDFSRVFIWIVSETPISMFVPLSPQPFSLQTIIKIISCTNFLHKTPIKSKIEVKPATNPLYFTQTKSFPRRVKICRIFCCNSSVSMQPLSKPIQVKLLLIFKWVILPECCVSNLLEIAPG